MFEGIFQFLCTLAIESFSVTIKADTYMLSKYTYVDYHNKLEEWLIAENNTFK